MISKHHPRIRNTYAGSKVISKGHPAWRSDHPQRLGEKYGVNPTSSMDAAIARNRPRGITPEAPPDAAGERTKTSDGRDLFTWVSVAEPDPKRPGAERLVWKLRSTTKNGAL